MNKIQIKIIETNLEILDILSHRYYLDKKIIQNDLTLSQLKGTSTYLVATREHFKIELVYFLMGWSQLRNEALILPRKRKQKGQSVNVTK